jgi:phage shock protein A
MTIREEVDTIINDANKAVQAGDSAIADQVVTVLVQVLADQVDDLHARVSRLEDQARGADVAPPVG